jgi:hypothetical protein
MQCIQHSHSAISPRLAINTEVRAFVTGAAVELFRTLTSWREKRVDLRKARMVTSAEQKLWNETLPVDNSQNRRPFFVDLGKYRGAPKAASCRRTWRMSRGETVLLSSCIRPVQLGLDWEGERFLAEGLEWRTP